MISASASAMSFASTDYTIDAAVLNNVGGYTSSGDYQLTSSGGEAAIGNGASGSYKLAAGYVAQIITPQMSLTIQPTGLIGEYPLDEGSGSTAYDGSSYASNGYTTGNPTWVTGQIGDALQFNGSQTVSLGDPTQDQTSPITIEAWVKPSTSQNAAVVGKSGAWALNVASSGSAIYNYGTSSNTCTDSTNLTDGNWHQIVATIQSGVSGGTTLYVDGVQKQTCTVTIQNQSSAISLAGVSGTAQYTGSIDAVKLFNRVLSADEVQAEYAAQSHGTPTGLTLQTITPGASNTSNFSVITATSGSSYALSINENHDLQNGTYTVPAISGSIASPIGWTEGTTKGLGFTLVSSTGGAISSSWGSGSNYAALPTTATSFYNRTGLQTSPDVLTMQLRADVTAGQASGSYTNILTITGTASP